MYDSDSDVKLFDAHTHLNMEEYSEEERADRMRTAAESKLAVVIDAGSNLTDSRQAVEDSAGYEWCYATVGIHPHYATGTTDEDIDIIRSMAVKYRYPAESTVVSDNEDSGCKGKVVAIGEVGLDFHFPGYSEEDQINVFRKQIRLALELGMPLMIHTRDADRLTFDILNEEGAFSDERCAMFPPRPIFDIGSNSVIKSGELPGWIRDTLMTGNTDGMLYGRDARVQLHCYSGSAELAKEYMRLGASFSLGGPITFKNSRKPVEVVQTIPLSCIMSETDAPYMAPTPFRGRPNRTEYVEHVVRRMAVLKGATYEETAKVLYENGCRFFDIVK